MSGEWPAEAAAIAAIGSAVFAFGALVLSGLALSANRASAEAAKRAASAAEMAVAMAREVNWQITRPEGPCVLANLGRDTAYGVKVEAASLIQEAVHEWDRVDGGESVVFHTGRMFGEDGDVVIIWHLLPDLSDPPQRSRRVLPPETPPPQRHR